MNKRSQPVGTYKKYCKDVRLNAKMKQHEIGKILGISRQSVGNIERGCYNPSLEVYLKYKEIDILTQTGQNYLLDHIAISKLNDRVNEFKLHLYTNPDHYSLPLPKETLLEHNSINPCLPFIIVAGGLGVGKTTYINAMKKHDDFHQYLEIQDVMQLPLNIRKQAYKIIVIKSYKNVEEYYNEE